MTDDELRDPFGDELTQALRSRSHATPTVDIASPVQRRGRRTRIRRRAFVAIIVAVAVGGFGLLAAQRHDSRRVEVVTAPTTTVTPPTSPGVRVVSYHGVHVEVPSAWPVVDGMHTPLCGDTFPTTPTAFVGPQQNPPPSCPVPFGAPATHDGVWLQPATIPTDARPVRTPSGQTVLEDFSRPHDPIRVLWFHDTSIEIGIGPTVKVANAIFASIRFTSGMPDTPATGVCARRNHPSTMPTPERLTTQLVLSNGTVTLRPPTPTDQPVMSATQAWNRQLDRESFEWYRIILARYSALFPASRGPNGGYVPENQNQLAWIIYSVPTSPTIAGCGHWGLEVFDAATGHGIESSAYGRGP